MRRYTPYNTSTPKPCLAQFYADRYRLARWFFRQQFGDAPRGSSRTPGVRGGFWRRLLG